VTLSMGGQQMQLGQEIAYALPDKVRSTFKTPMGDQVMVVDGDQGFVVAGGQTRDLPPERIADLMKTLERNLMVLTRYAGDPGLEALAGGTEKVDGQSCTLVQVAYNDLDSQLCIDDAGHVIKQSYQGKHPLQGTPGLIEVVFEDYSDVAGHMVPHTQIMSFDGQQIATLKLESLDVNPQIDPATFARPN